MYRGECSQFEGIVASWRSVFASWGGEEHSLDLTHIVQAMASPRNLAMCTS